MNEEKTTTWQWRQGYDYATDKYKAEIDRLRAEKAELREALSKCRDVLHSNQIHWTTEIADDILAKTAKEGE